MPGLGLTLLLLGCGTPPTTPPEPARRIADPAPPELPTDLAKAEFARIHGHYVAAQADGRLSPQECEQLAAEFDAVYRAQPRAMMVARYNSGALWDECGEPHKAQVIYEELADQGFHLALNALGVIAWDQGNPGRALELFAESVEADRTGALAARNNLAAAYRDRYASKASTDDFDQAEQQLQNVLAVDSGNKAAYENLARLYYDRGRLEDPSYLVLANLVVSQALGVLEAQGLESADLWNIQGLLSMADDDQARALRAFERAVTIDPTHADANRNIGFVAIRFRDYSGAVAALTKAIAHDSVARDVETHLALGVAQRGLGDFAEAERWYRSAAALEPRDPRPWYNLAILNQDHASSQPEVDQDQLVAHYELAKSHCATVEALAENRPGYASAVGDCRDRVAIIDDAFVSFEQAAALAIAVEHLEAINAAREVQRRKDLLELEREAMSAGLPSPEELADAQALAEESADGAIP